METNWEGIKNNKKKEFYWSEKEERLSRLVALLFG